jgi:hypothetical protein
MHQIPRLILKRQSDGTEFIFARGCFRMTWAMGMAGFGVLYLTQQMSLPEATANHKADDSLVFPSILMSVG